MLFISSFYASVSQVSKATINGIWRLHPYLHAVHVANTQKRKKNKDDDHSDTNKHIHEDYFTP